MYFANSCAFGHLTANPSFWTRLSPVHGRVYKKERTLKVSKCNVSERTSYELCAIWNLVHIKMYPLIQDRMKCSQWPVKMATNHFPNCSHNFAWRGVINHDLMIKLTFTNQIWYHFAIWVSKICISTGNILLDPECIHAWSDTSRPLHHRQRNDRLSLRCCLPWRHQRVTWITCSPLWRTLIHRILKSSLPQNNTFFIATVSVAKDAAYWIVHAPFIQHCGILTHR